MSTIVYWLADRTACGQYRCLLPGAELTSLGHEVIADETMTMGFIDRADVLVGQRVAKTGPSSLWQALARDKHRTARMVYELDDDVFALANEPSNPNHRVWPALLDNVRANLACADAVTVSTDVLADVVSAHTSAPVHVVLNAVPEYLLDMATPMGRKPHTVGWSGSATHDGDWAHDQTAEKILNWFDRSVFNDGWLLRTFGALPAPLHEAFEQAKVWHHHANGTPDLRRYYKRLSRWFDIGLAPLAPTAFNQSKSDLRLLELSALGIPWIASNWGPYAVGEQARGGLRVRGTAEWHEALTAVAGDEDMRRTLREQGRRWAATRTIPLVLPDWVKAFGLTE
jgi:hypothetical protein